MIPRVIPRPIGLGITGDPQKAEGATGLGLMGDPWKCETPISLGIIQNESGDHLGNVWGSPVIPHQPIYHQPLTNPETFPAFERNSRSAREGLWITDEFSAGVKR